MKPLFNPGDIVYFKKEFRSHYTSGYYYHKLNQPYKVLDWNTGFGLQTGSIQNLEDGVNHFVHSEMKDCLISESKWKLLLRQKNLNELLDNRNIIRSL
jgi:hypothetical protein